MAPIDIAIEAAGWTGAVLILAAYVLVSIGKLTGASPAFQWMNVVGAAGFVLNTAVHGAIPSMVLNIIWTGIGVVSLWRMRGKGKSR